MSQEQETFYVIQRDGSYWKGRNFAMRIRFVEKLSEVPQDGRFASEDSAVRAYSDQMNANTNKSKVTDHAFSVVKVDATYLLTEVSINRSKR